MLNEARVPPSIVHREFFFFALTGAASRLSNALVDTRLAPPPYGMPDRIAVTAFLRDVTGRFWSLGLATGIIRVRGRASRLGDLVSWCRGFCLAGERVRRTWHADAEAFHSRRGIPLRTGAGLHASSTAAMPAAVFGVGGSG